MFLSPSTQRRLRRLLWAGGLCGLAACRKDDIAVYRVPKDSPAETAAPVPDAVPSSAPMARWAVPAGWRPEAAAGMREASFVVPGPAGETGDMSVVTFPGSGGDDLANINRWRGQVSLPPVSAAEWAAQIEVVATPAGRFSLADLSGAGPKRGTRLLGAWLRTPDRVWFFKLLGPADLVAAQKPAFLAFLDSVSLEAIRGGNPAPPAGSGGDAAATEVALAWKVPGGWSNRPGSSLRKGSYASSAGCDVAVTVFPGDVGGILANVNRWRQQAGLDPIEEGSLSRVTRTIESHGLRLVYTEAEGGSTAIVAALVPWNGATWFFKLAGKPAAVEADKPAFLAFLQTVRAP